ncbi:MAG: RNA-binding protein hfq [Crocosphaera sp.]|nr:RNA-binding protein hfq [Crocosphaera sp.]
MTEFDTGLPSVRQIQKYIKEQQKIVIQLTTTETITGQVLWQDPQCLCVTDESNQSLLIWRQALIYIKPAP